MRGFATVILICLLGQVAFLDASIEQQVKHERVFDREKDFYALRAYPGREIPAQARLKAIKQLGQGLKLKAITSQSGRIWKPIGPEAVPNGQPFDLSRSPRIPVSGRATSVLVWPLDRSRIYLGTAQGGVWRSDDGGSSWRPITDNLPSLAVGTLALGPNNEIYLGTGEAHFSGSTYYGAGIFKSTDEGNTWQQAGQLPVRARVSTIAVNPSDARQVFAALASSGTGEAGVYKSTDGGNSWRRTLEGTATELTIDPSNPSTMLAAIGAIFGNSANGVYRSVDGGESWQLLRQLPSGFSVGRIELGRAKSAPNVLFASFSNTNPFTLAALYKSTDGGLSWTKLPNVPDYCSPQCWYNNVIAVHPARPDVVFLGGVGAYRSTDGGNSFVDVSSPTGSGLGLHADNHAFTFDPVDTNVVYSANDGGIFRSTDLGQNWTSLNNGLSTFQFQSIALHPTNEQYAIGGTQDNGTLLYTGSAIWKNIDLGDGGATAIDYLSPAILYHFYFYLLLARSDDGGERFSLKIDGLPILPNGLPSERTLFYAPLTMHPTEPNILYTGSTRLFRTTSRGDLWSAVSTDLTNGSGAISAIAVARSDPKVLFVGSSDGRLSKSTDEGLTWQTLRGLPNRAITGIAIDPTRPDSVYAVVSGFGTGHVYASTDGGNTWNDISDNLPDIPANAIVLDPAMPSRVYIGTDIGVFFSSTGRGQWVYLGEGMPKVAVLGLATNAHTGVIVAATHGRGMFQLALQVEDRAAPQVVLEQPRGGEVFFSGDKIELRWRSSDDTGVAFQEIQLIEDNESSTIVSGLSGSQSSFIWTVPQKETKARIRVIAHDAAGNVGSDESGLFTISSSRGRIDRISFNSAADKLTVDGDGFKVNDSVIEVDKVRLQKTKYPKKFRQPDGSISRLVGSDARLGQLLKPGQQVVISIVSISSGQRIAQATFTP